ncbi:hypothetical protein SLS58_008975 [Diplodia intermedia]|uniref:Uncharacterized protein n=1 Tax=Diplodia intermedia TaxID=856260 RepID=A0ABR3TF31_9PEZI
MAQTICEAWVHRLSPGKTRRAPSVSSSSSSSSSTSSPHAHYLRDLHASLAEITHNRGCIASETNEPLAALAHFTSFNAMMKAEFDKTPQLVQRDMRLAISWNELGNAHMLNRQWARGESCYNRSIDTMRRLAFFNETNLSLPIVNLGLSFWLQGKLDEALDKLFAGLREREKAFGSEDRESFITGRFLHALGNVYADMGRREESLRFHRKSLLHYKSTLGNNHHRTADVCVKVAEHSIRMKQEDTAMYGSPELFAFVSAAKSFDIDILSTRALLDHALKAYSNSKTYVPEKARALFKRSQVLKMMRSNKDAEETLQDATELYHEAVGKEESAKGKKAEELADQDFVELIAFWSR